MALINEIRDASTLPLPGSLATTMCHKNESKYSPDTVTFGRIVVRGAQDDQVVIPTTVNDTPIGLVQRYEIQDIDCNYVDGTVPAGCEIAVAHTGKFIVVAEDIVTEGNAVYWRATGADNTTTFGGGLRGDDDGGNAILLTGARWGSSTAAAGERAILHLNLP